jgi:hypothetical protein
MLARMFAGGGGAMGGKKSDVATTNQQDHSENPAPNYPNSARYAFKPDTKVGVIDGSWIQAEKGRRVREEEGKEHAGISARIPSSDDFVLHRVIGNGSMGVVWSAAARTNPANKFAIKVIDKSKLADATAENHTVCV